jgi:SAM-dependent methyltransferase
MGTGSNRIQARGLLAGPSPNTNLPPGSSLLTFLRKAVNTYLTPRFLFERVIQDKHFDAMLGTPSTPAALRVKIGRQVRRWFYFWPSITEAHSWANGRVGHDRDPNSFNVMWEGVDDLMLKTVVERVSSPDSAVLDLGCSSGRHLEYLSDNGLTNLSGVDVMEAALQVFKDLRPRLYGQVTTYHDFFQRFLAKGREDTYDLLYSCGATIELVHPSFDIVHHMCRVTRTHIVLVIYEDRHNYPRFYVNEFKKNGFVLVDSRRPIENTAISLLVFRAV